MWISQRKKITQVMIIRATGMIKAYTAMTDKNFHNSLGRPQYPLLTYFSHRKYFELLRSVTISARIIPIKSSLVKTPFNESFR
jgi:hypothetical protein